MEKIVFINKLKNMATKLATSSERLINRTLDKNLFTRVVSAAYLIASADGDFDSDERAALARLIKKDLSDFTIEDITAVIKQCDDKVAFDKGLGTQEIVDEIGKSAGNAEDEKQIMAVCAFIGKADGDYDADEKLMAKSICYALKLPPANYGL
jgi:tellurite resistance protein TerB